MSTKHRIIAPEVSDEAKADFDQRREETKAAARIEARDESQRTGVELPPLPERPLELAVLAARRGELRQQRQTVQDELARLQDAAWSESQRSNDSVDAAAEKIARGEIESVSRDVVPDEIGVLLSRIDLLQRAEQKVATRVAEARAAHNRQIVQALRPLHRRAVTRIYAALLELEAANAEEVAVRSAVPGAPMQACDFPNIGRRGPGGGPIQFWLEFARRQGLLDEGEPEATWPTAAY